MVKGIWLVVNEDKTEVCLFHRHDQPLIRVMIGGRAVTSKKSMNVLGVIFDSKLTWSLHIAQAISKANKALCALRMLKNFFTPKQMRMMLDSNFYSILYINAVIWLTPSLNSDLKHNLLAASACALRSCLMRFGFDISFDNLHKTHKKCTPSQITEYQIALNLHKSLNNVENDLSFERLMILDQIVCTSRQINFQTLRNFNTKIGLNTTANKFYHLNNKISFDRLNLSFVHFKKTAKIQFLKYGTT